MNAQTVGPQIFVPSGKKFATCVCVLAGAFAGLLGWGYGGNLWHLMLILLLPLAWAIARARRDIWFCVLSYYLLGSRDLPEAAVVFFGDSAPGWLGYVLWIGASLMLTMPFALLWSARREYRGIRFLSAVVVSAIPPLAIIGWLNPITAAGAFFPGWAWPGVFAFSGLMGCVASGQWKRSCLLIGCSVLAITRFEEVKIEPPSGWGALNTEFQRLASDSLYGPEQALAALRRTEWLKDVLTDFPPNSVAVLPETIIGRFDALTQDALASTEADLRKRGSRVMIGGELPSMDGRYQNAMIVLGAGATENRAAIQGIPVPFGMWRPWAADGAIADLWHTTNVINVRGERVAVAICYEQALSYTMLKMAGANTSLIVAPSNVWWARSTNIPDIQQQSVKAFAHLFGIPFIIAKNT